MNRRSIALTFVVCLLVGAAALAPRIAQAQDYHHFADERRCGIANCLNVVSNVAFLSAGIAGLAVAWRRRSYALFFAGTLLTTFGSAYYHLSPDNARLVWDRLPIVLSLSALTAAIVGERVSAHAERRVLWPLLALAAAGVLWWHWTERHGAGDLRLYALVQFGCLLVIGAILALYPATGGSSGWLVAGLTAYGVAKLFELLDAPLLHATATLVSGHSLKHLCAAAAVGCVARHCRRNRPVHLIV